MARKIDYFEWCESVRAEYLKLAEVSYYLSEDGKERLMVFDLLDTLALSFADTAEDLLRMLEDRNCEDDIAEIMESKHIRLPLMALKRIVST